MAVVLDCDTRGHELTVMKLEDKWFYTMVFPVHDGSREYDRNASKAGSNGRGRRHVPGNVKQEFLVQNEMPYFAALSEGVWRSKCPSGSNVAVVSKWNASNPCPSSVRQNWPLETVNKPQIVVTATKYTDETSKSITSLRRGARSGRPFKYVAKVPAQRLYWMVRRVSAAPSINAMGSVCIFQNLGER